MSPENVKEQASRYRKLSLNETDEPEVWVAWRKETSIRLWFEDSRLQAHKVMWFYPITNSGARFKTNICTGQRFVDLQVLGPRESASAAVLLDGRKVGELSSAGSASFDVPLGNHRLTVEGPGMESQTFELRYDEMSSPRDALQVGPDNE